MSYYTSSEISSISIGQSINGLIDLSLFENDSISVTVMPIISKVNSRISVTIKKNISLNVIIYDLDEDVKGYIDNFEASFKPIYIKCVFLNPAKSFITRPKTIGVEEIYNSDNELIGYDIQQEYSVSPVDSPFLPLSTTPNYGDLLSNNLVLLDMSEYPTTNLELILIE